MKRSKHFPSHFKNGGFFTDLTWTRVQQKCTYWDSLNRLQALTIHLKNDFQARGKIFLLMYDEIFTLRNTVDFTAGEHKELTLDLPFKIPGETTKPGRFI